MRGGGRHNRGTYNRTVGARRGDTMTNTSAATIALRLLTDREGPPVVSTTPPHPEASPDRPGAVTVSRIVARNSGHPQPYTGAGGSTQALGGWAGSKLERVEFPAGGRPPGPWGPVRCHLAVPAEIRRFLVCGGIAVA